MEDFKVIFRGVRGSFPVADKKYLKYGGNTSCVEVNAGGNIIILDAGTGIVNCGDKLISEYLSSALDINDRKPIKATILLSHIHQDHLLGLTFFKPMHLKSTQLHIFGNGSKNSDLEGDLKTLVFGKTFPIDLGDIACNIEINNLCKECAILIKKDKSPKLVLIKELKPGKDDVVINFYKSYVHPQDGVIVYKISYN